jgi:ribose transport system ATP-binding protein
VQPAPDQLALITKESVDTLERKSMTSEFLLAAEEICKSFPGVQALDSVDFNLRKGEVHAILGENGAGKSTLIKVLGGVYQADSGCVYLNGEEIKLNDPRHAQQFGIRVIHQELNLLPQLSVAENIFLGNIPNRGLTGFVDWKEMRARAETLLAKLGLNLNVSAPVSKLTAGEQQLVEIAQALTTDLQILIMDEPSAALNDTEVDTLFGLLKTMTDSGIGVIYITHRIAEALRIADRITVLRDGILAGSLDADSVSEEELVRLMVGRSLDEMYPRSWTEVGDVVLEVRDLFTEDGLSDISLELHAGEILGIYGLMGAGRTKLANALFGISHISSGTVFVRGQEVKLKSPSHARHLGLGYIPVERKVEGLVMPLSVRKNLSLASMDKYSRGPFIQEQKEKQGTRHWVDLLQIRTPSLDAKITGLSGGNQQKVVVGRWLDAESKILILNEPTRGIDVGAKVEIYTLMDDLCHQGAGILMFSSEMPELLAIANRILVMSRGRITGESSHGKATQEELMRCAVL